MSLLDWTFVILLAVAIVCFFFGLMNSVRLLLLNGKRKKFKRRPPKEKSKRRRFLSARKEWLQQRKTLATITVLFFASGLFLMGGSWVTRNFQQNTLPAEDSQVIAQTYIALNDLETQLGEFETGENREKAMNNIGELTATLETASFRTTSTVLTQEKQRIVNQYYRAVRQLARNIKAQTQTQLAGEGMIAGYLTDIETIKGYQNTIFEEFNVNEDALENQL
ncbi:hypothetical protein [Enterococcus sp. HY326]|uniref:hypothetical protein n=1 Tax=Enterococcus sp. HY326 TaxID=2971265 RepID=UPI00223FDD9A|nr:hypothetical protein [Enterococcus sp. HY326]